MSYYAVHKISWDTPDLLEETVIKRLTDLTGEDEQWVRDTALEGCSEKWSDSDTHMTQLSVEHPQTVFSLDCAGEDGTRTMTFFHHGMMETLEFEPPRFEADRFALNGRPGYVPAPASVRQSA